MKQLAYVHRNLPPLVLVVHRWLRLVVGRLVLSIAGRPAWTRRRAKTLGALGVVFLLIVQGIMLWILAGLVDLCISLMEVWAELAAKHLEIVLDETT